MKKFTIIMILAFIAFLNAWYLTSKAYGRLSWSTVCDINSTFSCEIAMSHPAAYIGPIVFPAVALVVYPVIFFLAFFGSRSSNPKKHFSILKYISAGGILFNSYFIYQETFTIKAFCPLCLLCTAIIITIFILSITWEKSSK